MGKPLDPVPRLQKRIAVQPDGCWLWTTGLNRGGYGSFHIGGRRTTAHRAMYEVVYGPVADGLVVDHLCRNRSCVNPYHLEAVSQRENCRRGIRGRLTTHCPRGHEYTPENTRIYRGMRGCKKCHALRERARRARLVLEPGDLEPVAWEEGA